MSTYAEIVSSIQDYHEDDSAELLAAIPNLIALAEDRIFGDVPNIIGFRATETGTLTSGVATMLIVATDNRQIRDLSVMVGTNLVFLFERQEDYLRQYWTNPTTTAEPKYYAQQSTDDTGAITLLIAPTPDSAYTYTLNYKGQTSRLTASNTETFLSLVFPDILKRASVYEASIFLESSTDVLGVLKTEYNEAKNLLAVTVERGYLEKEA